MSYSSRLFPPSSLAITLPRSSYFISSLALVCASNKIECLPAELSPFLCNLPSLSLPRSPVCEYVNIFLLPSIASFVHLPSSLLVVLSTSWSHTPSRILPFVNVPLLPSKGKLSPSFNQSLPMPTPPPPLPRRPPRSLLSLQLLGQGLGNGDQVAVRAARVPLHLCEI